MKLNDLVIESSTVADFYFDPEEKVITGEFRECNFAFAVKGHERERIEFIVNMLEARALQGHFDNIESAEELLNEEI